MPRASLQLISWKMGCKMEWSMPLTTGKAFPRCQIQPTGSRLKALALENGSQAADTSVEPQHCKLAQEASSDQDRAGVCWRQERGAPPVAYSAWALSHLSRFTQTCTGQITGMGSSKPIRAAEAYRIQGTIDLSSRGELIPPTSMK